MTEYKENCQNWRKQSSQVTPHCQDHPSVTVGRLVVVWRARAARSKVRRSDLRSKDFSHRRIKNSFMYSFALKQFLTFHSEDPGSHVDSGIRQAFHRFRYFDMGDCKQLKTPNKYKIKQESPLSRHLDELIGFY